MQKTVTISIGGLSFQLEEDAYRRLEDYLEALKRHFSASADAGDIVADFEARIAEKLSERTGTGPVTLAEVSAITESLGRPEDFDAAPERGEQKASKKFYRNPDDALLGGVCSGLGAYLGWDAVWVRLIFVLFTLANGFGVALYLVLWIIVPEAKTPAEKLRMQGEPFTVKNVQETVKQRVEEIKRRDPEQAKAKAAALLRAPFEALRKLLGFLGKALRAIVRPLGAVIGVAVAIGTAGAMAGLVFVLVVLLFGLSSPYVDPVISSLAKDSWYYLGLWSVFFLVFLPVLFLFQMAAALISGKWLFPKATALGLAAVWIVSGGMAAAAALQLGPEIEQRMAQDPRYQTTTRELKVDAFDRLSLGGAARLTVTLGSPARVVATGPAGAVGELELIQQGTDVKISRAFREHFCLFCREDAVTIQVTVPELSYLELSGASRAQFDSPVEGTLELKLSGASRAELEAGGGNLKANLSGSSRLTLSGFAERLDATLSGASRIEAAQSDVFEASLRLSGASRANLGEVQVLTVDASGASRVYYSGSPEIEQRLSGASKVTPKDAEVNGLRLEDPDRLFDEPPAISN